MVAASPIGVANSPGQNARSALVNLTSPQAVSALVNEALKGTKSGQVSSALQTAGSSPCGNPLAALTNPMSPLLKSVGPVSPVYSSPGVSIPNGSPRCSKSPAPKIVTVSKLPSTSAATPNDQITTLLQSLQQSPGVLTRQVNCDTNGHVSDPSTQIPST